MTSRGEKDRENGYMYSKLDTIAPVASIKTAADRAIRVFGNLQDFESGAY